MLLPSLGYRLIDKPTHTHTHIEVTIVQKMFVAEQDKFAQQPMHKCFKVGGFLLRVIPHSQSPRLFFTVEKWDVTVGSISGYSSCQKWNSYITNLSSVFHSWFRIRVINFLNWLPTKVRELSLNCCLPITTGRNRFMAFLRALTWNEHKQPFFADPIFLISICYTASQICLSVTKSLRKIDLSINFSTIWYS